MFDGGGSFFNPVSQAPEQNTVFWKAVQLLITPPDMSLAATTEEEQLVANVHFVPLLKDGCDLLAEILSILSELLQALVYFIVLGEEMTGKL